MTFVVTRECPDQPEVAALLAAADARSAALYPAESRHGMTIAALVAAGARFFVARASGQAVGCGGYTLLTDHGAELKRLFVTPEMRRWRIGQAIVQEV